MDANHTILDYALPTSPPRRVWLPVLCLATTFVIWYWPRLTPIFFPNTLDIAALIILLPASFLIARTTSLPGWVFVAFGASGVMLFLLANFNDNNFAANTSARDIVLPWSGWVLGGAIAARCMAAAARSAAR